MADSRISSVLLDEPGRGPAALSFTDGAEASGEGDIRAKRRHSSDGA